MLFKEGSHSKILPAPPCGSIGEQSRRVMGDTLHMHLLAVSRHGCKDWQGTAY